MKNSTLLAFFAGFATATAAVYGAGATSPALAAGAGAAAALSAPLAFLLAPRNARRIAVTLSRYADRKTPADPSAGRQPDSQTARPADPPRPKRAPKPAPVEISPLEAELISALINLGAPKPRARAAAAAAIATGPADLPAALKVATKQL